MRVVAALGGNALLERRDAPLAELQSRHVREAVAALAPIAESHELVVTHGNGPQVGLLALESAEDRSLTHPYPLDVLGAETQGMVGYLLVQALGNALAGREVAGLLTQTVVDPDDPAFASPTKFVGPCYTAQDAQRLAVAHRWTVREDGGSWRRVVASPEPLEIVELATVLRLLAARTVVVCSGGGGIPVARGPGGRLRGVEAVIDKDLTASLLARALDADALLILTDVPGVEVGFGTSAARVLHSLRPDPAALEGLPAGSMRPKVDAAMRFARATGRAAAIGRLEEAVALLAGTAGTVVGGR